MAKVILEVDMDDADLEKSIRFVWGDRPLSDETLQQIKEDHFNGPIVFNMNDHTNEETRRYNCNGLVALAVMLKP